MDRASGFEPDSWGFESLRGRKGDNMEIKIGNKDYEISIKDGVDELELEYKDRSYTRSIRFGYHALDDMIQCLQTFKERREKERADREGYLRGS